MDAAEWKGALPPLTREFEGEALIETEELHMQNRLLHGGDYNPDQWLNNPKILADDIQLMQKVKANAFSVGIFAWSALEPEEGVFEFGWLDKIMDDIASFGGKVILATPSAARPNWMAQKYPEVLRVNARREKMLFGGRHNHCFSSPIYREKTALINRKLAERYKNHNALLMWHISNEFGGECHCALCRENFRQWLEIKYKHISTLNDAYWTAFWSHKYNDFSQVEPPSPIGEDGVHGLTLDWRRFVSDQTIDFYRSEIAPIKEITPDIPITTNFMGEIAPPHIYPHPFAGLDYAKFAKEVDVISWDAYPPWHNDFETTEFLASKLAFLNDYFRALKGKPFLILESTPSAVNWHPINKAKRPGMHLLSAIACLAHGADAIMYFQWRKSRGSSEKFHGAVVDHDNSPNNRVFKDVQQLGEILEKISEIKDSKTPAKIALLYDVEIFWVLDDVQGFNRNDKKYTETLLKHYRVFWGRNIPIDVVTKDKDLSSYDLVIAPMVYMLDEAFSLSLRSYVEGGGTLVSTYVSGIVNETDLVYPGAFSPTLREIFGINVLETDTLYPTDRNGIILESGKEYAAFDYCAVIEAEKSEVLGTYKDDFYKGSPAFTCNHFGNGRAYFIAARTDSDFLEDFYATLVQNEIPITASRGVSVQIRQNDMFKYYFVMNFTEEEKEVTIQQDMEDIITQQTIAAGKHSVKPYGVFILKTRS